MHDLGLRCPGSPIHDHNPSDLPYWQLLPRDSLRSCVSPLASTTSSAPTPPFHCYRHWLRTGRGSPGGSVVRNPPAMQGVQKAWVRSLGQEDPLEECMAIHSSILAWRIPWTEEPGGLQSTGSWSQTWLKWPSTHARTYTGNLSHDQRLCLPGRALWLESEVWPHPSGLLSHVQGTSTHPILCFYVLHPPMGLIAFIYLLGVLWRNHSHGTLSLLGISAARVEGWARWISMCGPSSCGLGNLIWTQSLIWEATSGILFFSLGHLKSGWGLLNLKEHIYKHTCIIFVISFDDDEEKDEKPQRLELGADMPTWHHS